MRCPSCAGELVELDRSGVRIDACRNCRGVWLDRGELERILERERAGRRRRRRRGLHPRDDRRAAQAQAELRVDRETAQTMYSDYRSHKQHKKKRKKSFLDELFD